MMENQDLIALSHEHPILFFDGTCHLCDGAVQFVLKRDPRMVFRFCPLQTDIARKTLSNHMSSPLPDSLVLLSSGRFYLYSDAALHTLTHLAWYYAWIGRGLMVFPRYVRDIVYRFVARNRYRWFGKYDVCMIPAPGWKDQFIQD